MAENRGPLWRCDRCHALQSKRYLRAWHTLDAQFTLCYECTLSIILMWFAEHEEEIRARRRTGLEAP